jgi:16S rRNA (guanine527-N7)-methyltransferase
MQASIISPVNELAQSAQALLGIRLTQGQISSFNIYERELLEWNERHNLTAIRDPKQVHIKHFLDSLSCLLVLRDTAMDKIIDVGTGAGFPGIPLKIVCPSIQLTLAESVGKKADFCAHLVKKLGMSGVEVVQERAENLGQLPAYRERFNWAVARAVAEMPVLAEYLLPLVQVGGMVLAMKGETAPAEAHAADRAFRLLGGHLRRLVPVSLPGVADQRFLVVVDKIAATPSNYPRRAGMPSKRPL